ncbi:hypothetical protein BGP77_15280 [Saccharospirillum sp. MSK14-1]|uniref:hypothetical protein n=1 Tax=Saccharospirillum sp. MSK14-1 TaxID=1897632 RepID=UPI000D3AFE35|nr:hypothetical protein [Saccharospirillum sp. MSK14-1]PTY37834.1 hypothetical protein BGP77_15280 [Saccharospirillum sp. MSK14-1]
MPAYRNHHLLLLTDDAALAEHIEQALTGYQLSHHLHSYSSIDQYQEAALGPGVTAEPMARIDLCLIAYLGDSERARSAVEEIRLLPRWRSIPLVVLIDGDNPALTRMLYQFGANSVLRYPLRFDSLRELICTMDTYWFDVVTLPPPSQS